MSTQSDTILVIANLHVREASVAPAIAVMRDLASASRREAGCLRFEVLQHATDPTQLVVVEAWRGEAAADAHMQSGHVQAALAQLEPLLAGPPRLTRYHELG